MTKHTKHILAARCWYTLFQKCAKSRNKFYHVCTVSCVPAKIGEWKSAKVELRNLFVNEDTKEETPWGERSFSNMKPKPTKNQLWRLQNAEKRRKNDDVEWVKQQRKGSGKKFTISQCHRKSYCSFRILYFLYYLMENENTKKKSLYWG